MPTLDCLRLTFAEFSVAFGVYREVVCEVYPARRAELDTYLAIISDLVVSYGGTLFYEYHKSFSAKAAMFIQRFNQRLDWSTVDLALISRHFTGHQVLSCSICGSLAHSTALCSQASTRLAYSGSSSRPAPQVNAQKTPVCFNCNEKLCKMCNCKYLHT